MFGKRTSVDAEAWKQASRPRNVRVNIPMPEKIQPCKVGPRLNDRVGDRYEWAPNEDARDMNGRVPVQFHGLYTKFLSQKVAGTPPLSALAEVSLASWQVRHVDTNVVSHAPVVFFLDYMGYGGTVLEKILDHPRCDGFLETRHFTAVTSDNPSAMACGQVMFCPQCAEKMWLLQRGMERRSMTEAVYTALFKAVNLWELMAIEKNKIRNQFHNFYQAPAHLCGRTCRWNELHPKTGGK